MMLKAPINENYAATVVEIKNIIPLDNCDNVVHTNIFGNLVIVGKDTKVGDKVLFFPVETKLSIQYLSENNLFRDNTLNTNNTEKGYFEENGRIRCVKFRTHRSQGFVIPVYSLLKFADVKDLATLKEGDTFDHINGIKICEKYVPKEARTPGQGGTKQGKKPKESRIVDGQFTLHSDTSHLGKNIHKITPDTLISITNKLHGTSFVVSKVLVKRKLNWFDKLLKWTGVQIVDTEYDMIYSSRKVIKNDTTKDYNHYYKDDVWKYAADELRGYILDGMTIYGELVGFTPSGEAIQKGYDYGYKPRERQPNGFEWPSQGDYEDYEEDIHFGIYIYRITYTNLRGVKFEFSANQVQQWCKHNGLNAVPEYFYGRAKELVGTIVADGQGYKELSLEEWQALFLMTLQKSYNMEKDCELCKNKVPAEGLVVRVERFDYEAYKLKSFRFSERETKELDKGEIDIETQQSE